jgi:CBS domain-containing protein
MVELRVRHLPVVDHGRLVGMLWARDIVTSDARFAESLAYEPLVGEGAGAAGRGNTPGLRGVLVWQAMRIAMSTAIERSSSRD